MTLTVGQLRKALEVVPDDTPICVERDGDMELLNAREAEYIFPEKASDTCSHDTEGYFIITGIEQELP